MTQEGRLTAEEIRVIAMARFVVYAWQDLGREERCLGLTATIWELTNAVEALDGRKV